MEFRRTGGEGSIETLGHKAPHIAWDLGSSPGEGEDRQVRDHWTGSSEWTVSHMVGRTGENAAYRTGKSTEDK